MNKHKLIYILMPILMINFVLAINIGTNKVDDYVTNNGNSSTGYTFSIDGTIKQALKKNNSTNMTWADWLKINHGNGNEASFNSEDFKVITTSGLQNNDKKTAYVLSYNLNNGSLNNSDMDFVYEGNSITLPTVSRTGYTFDGWYTNLNGGTSVGNSGNSYIPTNDITLYAKWTAINYTITYNLEGGTNNTSNPSSYTVETSTFTLQNPTKTGYTFTGWTGSNGGTPQESITISQGSTGNKAYTANWKEIPLDTISSAEFTTWYDELNNELKYQIDGKDTVFVSGGSSSYTFSLDSNTIIDTITNDTIKLKSDTRPGKYTENIKVKDNITNEEKEIALTIYVKYLMTKENTVVTFEELTYTGKAIEPKETVEIKLNNKDGEKIVLENEKYDKYYLEIEEKKSCKKNVSCTAVENTGEDKNTNPWNLDETSKNNGCSIANKPDNATTWTQETECTILPNIDAGTYKAYLGTGNDKIYTTSKSNVAAEIQQSKLEYSFTVKKANTSVLTNFSYLDEWEYTGSEIKPVIYSASSADNSISINKEQIEAQFEINYSNNVNPTNDTNKANIELTPKTTSNFEGDSKKLDFKIFAQQMNITVINGYAVYNGQEQDGGASVSVADNVTGAQILYSTNKDSWTKTLPKFSEVGEHTVYYKVEHTWYSTMEGNLTITITKADNPLNITNLKNFSGTYPYSFEFNYSLTFPTEVVVKENGEKATVEITQNNDKKSGNVKVTPSAKTNDYESTIVFEAKETTNTNFSTATVSYSLTLGEIGVTTQDQTIVYDGNEHEISYKVTGPEGVTTNFRYYENQTLKTVTTTPKFKNAGTYTIYYTASKTGYKDRNGQITLTINPKSIQNATVTVKTEEDGFIYYDGSQKTPEVEVKLDNKTLTKGVDYETTYKNNIEVGTATVVITGKGNYTGSISREFTITSKNDTSVKITWRELNENKVLTDKEASYDKEETWTYNNSTTKELTINTIYTGNSQNAYTELKISPKNGQIYFTDEDRDATENDSREMPTKTTAGKYKINFLIKWHGYKDVKGYFYLNIQKLTLNIPSPQSNTVCLKVDGDNNPMSTSPIWTNYNPIYMSMGNDTSKKEKGSYSATFELVDKVNTQWNDNTVSPETISWNIGDKCNRSDEIVYELNMVYGQYKELMLENKVNNDGTTTFENQKTMFMREGYVQAGWVENRDDHSKKYDIAANVINLAENQDDVVDLYALWERAIYTLDIDYDGGRLPNTTTTADGITRNSILTNPSVVAYDTYFTLTEPIKPGYTFMGWEIWNMDETEHYIGTIITKDTTYETMENIFKNLTSVPNSTVYFKAKWEANKLWTKNYTYTVNSSVSKYVINNAFEETKNGSGNYTYEITSVSPKTSCNFVVTDNSLNYGYNTCPDKGLLQGFSIDKDKNLTVPSYLKVGTYTVAIKTKDEFTKKETTFYIDVTVKNPKITIEDKTGSSTTNKTYEYEPSQTIKQWVDSNHNSDGTGKKYELIKDCHVD